MRTSDTLHPFSVLHPPHTKQELSALYRRLTHPQKLARHMQNTYNTGVPFFYPLFFAGKESRMQAPKTVLFAFDSFKGTLSAQSACDIVAQAWCRIFPDTSTTKLPIADGGEGLVDAYLHIAGGEACHCTVQGPFGEPVQAKYGILKSGAAIIEMAACAGLPLASGRENPLRASTFGLGKLLLDAEKRGATQIILGLGGSATNDCGIGMAAALGYRFYDGDGNLLAPLAENLERIEKLERPSHMPNFSVVAACDVDNPLTGPHGATYTFGRQKGADDAMLARLEAGMVHFSGVLRRAFSRDVVPISGAGAAGGLGAGVLTFLNGSLQPGIELLLNAADFDTLVQQADLIVTGEGRIDYQTAHGKVPAGIARRAKQYNKPCIALCGAIGKNAEAVYACGIDAVFSATPGICTWEDVQQESAQNLAALAENVARLTKTILTMQP